MLVSSCPPWSTPATVGLTKPTPSRVNMRIIKLNADGREYTLFVIGRVWKSFWHKNPSCSISTFHLTDTFREQVNSLLDSNSFESNKIQQRIPALRS